jgi:hypothetical protein
MASAGSSEAYKRVVGGKLNLKGGLSLKPDAGVKKKKKKKKESKVDEHADGKELVVAAECEEAKGTLRLSSR